MYMLKTHYKFPKIKKKSFKIIKKTGGKQLGKIFDSHHWPPHAHIHTSTCIQAYTDINDYTQTHIKHNKFYTLI